MPQNSAALAALVGSRLCHDLISPVGAMQNGIELIGMSGDMAGSPEMALIQESCENASARIRFFRVAFGSASGGQSVARREVLKTLDDMAAGGRVSIDWQVEGDADRGAVQLAFLALMCCETALGAGGTITISETDGRWMISGSGARLTVTPDVWGLLDGREEAEVQPSTVQFVLLNVLAAERGLVLDTSLAETEACIRIG
ncbi:MAG: histidine phosphotransferase family protein [Paracoccaceae bacterium]|nr:histidine phosphotransferase family protein [Paracoccaceae bacterium]